MREPPAVAGVAALIDEFFGALDLDDVVLVGNDTGGAIAQIVGTAYPQRLGALVLTSCDAFEQFPPARTAIGVLRQASSARTLTQEMT
jgi:pimeloyl-ACP methyl ester carboxylesterase